jgi:hypothetical protein
LKAAVSQDEAVKMLAGGLTGAARRLRLGPLRSIADVYVPFDVFRVRIARGARQETAFVGIDAVSGTLDLYGFARLPAPEDLVDVSTANALGRALSDADARARVQARVARIVFQRAGFFAVRPGAVTIEGREGGLHVPYWVGFFGRGDEARVEVLDAVRRRIEGSKAKRLVRESLTIYRAEEEYFR